MTTLLATSRRPPRRSIDEVLAEARQGLQRLSPAQARERWAAGAVVVDIRPAAQRAQEGDCPGRCWSSAMCWRSRFDPATDARLPIASYGLEVVVLCQECYTSSLAAAALQDLGIPRATDVTGGFAAWRQPARRS